MRPCTYLDYNATQPVKPAVREAMLDALEFPSNASSVHRLGQQARHAVERARAEVASLIGAEPAEIVFTAGATEANATALNGIPNRILLASAIEHPSVGNARQEQLTVPVRADGLVDLDALDRMLAALAEPALVSLMLVNNETGVIQPVAEAAAIAHRHEALIHSDAAQAPGRIPVDVRALDVDLLTLSAHKMGGPQGAGALYIRDSVTLAPLLRGGGQERRRRAGTENVAAIAGFGVAAWLTAEDAGLNAQLTALRDEMEARLVAIAPDVAIHGRTVPRVCNTSCFGVPGLLAETLLIALDLAGIAVSSGAACSSGAVEPSPVLLAMGVPEAAAREAIRVSLGWDSTRTDIDRLVETWADVHRRAKSSMSSATRLSKQELSV
ncbi:MAG TPA: cysteine desulfurase family protein [Alphaproteobacteria bacterium]|jgi:cysteine desulfurase|nr:cysteine desulfurase family protein [Alphaproteobacteria bacterium]